MDTLLESKNTEIFSLLEKISTLDGENNYKEAKLNKLEADINILRSKQLIISRETKNPEKKTINNFPNSQYESELDSLNTTISKLESNLKMAIEREKISLEAVKNSKIDLSKLSKRY